MKKIKIFIAICIFWFLALGGFILFKEYTLMNGKEILLKTKPVDPRDLFRGDYVILAYDISEIKIKNDTNKSKFKTGDKVFVSLDIDNNGIGKVKNISLNKPDDVFIKGVVRYSSRMNKSEETIRVRYGIESYFVPEGMGREIERNLRYTYAKVSVDDFGGAVVESLVLDGEEVNFKK